MINDIENKIENVRLQECSLKNRSFWKLIVSLETYMKRRQQLYDYVIFLENKIVWIWNSLDIQATNSSVELYNILSFSRGFFNNFLGQFLEKSA